MSTLRAIKNRIIFQFEDEIVRKSDTGKKRSQFAERTDWGFEISNYDESAKAPRWGIVTSVGPDIVEKEIKKGSKVLIESLQWTEAMKIDGTSFWGTDESKIMALDESV